MDIAHDRAGYYLCWGCLNWVPAVYTSPALHLAAQPTHLGTRTAAAILFAGAACVFINYDSDRQRQVSGPSGFNMMLTPPTWPPLATVSTCNINHMIAAAAPSTESVLLRSDWNAAATCRYGSAGCRHIV